MDLFLSSSFSSHVEDLINQHRVPGLAVAVVQDGQTASAGYGMACLQTSKLCTADTLFDIASSAKSLTAASIALLVDDENHPEVQYDAIMSKLLPGDFVMPSVEYTEGVTVEDVLSHRTGMPGHDNSYMGPRAAQPDDARSITRNLRNLPVTAPLRARYLYCNMMYTVATHLVEVKSQQSFSDFLHSRFFQPLDMASTTLQPGSARARGLGERIATGYRWDRSTSQYEGFQSPDCPESQGAGSIITSANDFIKWVRALVNREHPINDRLYRGLIRMRSLPNPNAMRLKPYTSPAMYAAGMEVHYYRGFMVVGHNGVIPGFASRFFFLPDFKFGAVIMGNSDGAGSVATILARVLIDEVLKVPEPDRRPGPNKNKTQGNTKSRQPVNPAHRTQDRPQDKGKTKKEDTNRATDEVQDAQTQEMPLDAYTGSYWHPGYQSLVVQTKDDKLFIDATDRSNGFTLTFSHVCDQTKYVAHLNDFYEGGDDPLQAEFVIEDGRAVKMGLQLEFALKNKLIWFDRVK